MIGWAITFAILALVAAILGFGGVAGAFADIAIILFFIALVVAVAFAVIGYRAGRRIIH